MILRYYCPWLLCVIASSPWLLCVIASSPLVDAKKQVSQSYHTKCSYFRLFLNLSWNVR